MIPYDLTDDELMEKKQAQEFADQVYFIRILQFFDMLDIVRLQKVIVASSPRNKPIRYAANDILNHYYKECQKILQSISEYSLRCGIIPYQFDKSLIDLLIQDSVQASFLEQGILAQQENHEKIDLSKLLEEWKTANPQ